MDPDVEIIAQVVTVPGAHEAIAGLLSDPLLINGAIAVVSSWLLSLLTGATRRLSAWAARRPSTVWRERVQRWLRYEPAARDLIPWIAPVVLGAVCGGYAAWRGTGTVGGAAQGVLAGLVAVGLSQASRARAKAAESARAARSPRDGERR